MEKQNKWKIVYFIILMFVSHIIFAEGNNSKHVLIVIGSVTELLKNEDGTVDSVTSATKYMHGSAGESTMEIGIRMKTYLTDKNFYADVIRSEDPAPELSDYDLIIIGSSIEGGIPKASVKTFIDTHREKLSEMNVAVFASCGGLTSRHKGTRERSLLFADRVSNGLNPVSKTVFEGENPDMGFWLNLLSWNVVLGTKTGDRRNWEAVEKWTLSLLEYK